MYREELERELIQIEGKMLHLVSLKKRIRKILYERVNQYIKLKPLFKQPEQPKIYKIRQKTWFNAIREKIRHKQCVRRWTKRMDDSNVK